MAVDTKAIKHKISSIGNVRKLTKTMEMVSVAKMKRSVENRKNSADFARYALSILGKIAYRHDIQHPLFTNRGSGKYLIVIIASDKGLCGPFNTRIERQVSDFIHKHNGIIEIDAITIGKKAKKIADKHNLLIRQELPAYSEKVSDSDVQGLIDDLKRYFIQDDLYREIHVVYTEFVSSLEFKAIQKKILPLSKDILLKNESSHIYTLEPDEETILEELLPILLQIAVYQFTLESLASEHSSRMLAMRNASDNASRLKDKFL